MNPNETRAGRELASLAVSPPLPRESFAHWLSEQPQCLHPEETLATWVGLWMFGHPLESERCDREEPIWLKLLRAVVGPREIKAAELASAVRAQREVRSA